jgi:hypothetical protein
MAKAIAGASGVPFLFATGSGFANMFLGIGNMKVRRLFKKARNMSDKYGGAVIFIDEIDAVGARGAVSDRSTTDRSTHRVIMGGMGMGGGMGVINELLVQMDGFTVPRGVWRHVLRIVFRARPKVPFYNILVIAATNRAATLDPALLRPGRFDRKIHVGLPDAEGREDICRYYLAKVRHEPIDHAKLSRMTVGYSPAMLKNIVNEALLFALQDGRDALRWDDLWQAKLSEEIGLKQSVKYSAREKEMVAVHEAAHAVASYSLERGERRSRSSRSRSESALGLCRRRRSREMFLRTRRPRSHIRSPRGAVAEESGSGRRPRSVSGPGERDPHAAAYVGVYGMAGASSRPRRRVGGGGRPDRPPARRRRAAQGDRRDPERVPRVRSSCCRSVHVSRASADALLEREELIGDEIQAPMAGSREREPSRSRRRCRQRCEGPSVSARGGERSGTDTAG